MKKTIIFLTISLIIGSTKAQTLKFRFTFDEKLTDETENAYTLTPGAATTVKYVDGKYGKAVELNGTSDYFDLLTGNIINPALTSYSACAWVYNTQPQSDWVFSGGFDEEQIIHQLNGASDTRGRIVLHHIINETNSTIQTVIGNNSQRADENVFTVGQWQHVAVVSDPVTKNHKFYVNGVLVGDRTITQSFENCTGGFRIGAHKLGDRSFWHGLIDDVCMFEGALTQSEIISVMNQSIFTSVVPVKSEMKISVSPNPVNGIATITNIENVAEISVMSLDGRTVLVKHFSNTIDLSGLNSGHYLLKVVGENRIQTYCKVIVN
ncbi:MAG: LamG-like jellyroll fold domain-containing protein [Lentimicrobium sp.]|jgi:hypothetical protein|nr:LamG-like jellyroll fold domain-containing protein [Lentimicrobium sp.]